MEINWRAGRQKLANFKVIFDLFISCFYFIQQQKYKLYYVTLMIFSEIQSKRAHWSFYSSKVKAPADFSHHAILATWISLKRSSVTSVNFIFYECLAEYAASLNLRNVVWAR